MNIKKTVLLIISFCLLIIFLFPLVIMIYTSFIPPQGNMTNIVKDYYLNDFEAGYMSVIKRTIAPLGNTDYLLAKESPTSTQSLKIESTSERNPGIKMIGATRDLRKNKNLELLVEGRNSRYQ